MLCITDLPLSTWICYCGIENHHDNDECYHCEMPAIQQEIHECCNCGENTCWDSEECHKCGMPEQIMYCRECDGDTLHRAFRCIECHCHFDMTKVLKQATEEKNNDIK